ncbi:MAG: acyltransferase [Pseudacidovorax sp.]|nr:acyltransferase [Pseudacidovorax sp.]
MPPSPATPSSLSHPAYRPDIDGLRAIAVLSVIIFHASPRWLPGGFVGVDIFFVISGFLISTIMFGSLAGGGFSYAEFYARRIRRIFPGLVLVLIATLAFGWWVLLADEFRQLGKHVLASAGFVANLVLWGEAGYFDTVVETKPLLHLWSLAVEEQFYIFWPLLLTLAWKRQHLLRWMGVAVGLSFLLNVGLVVRHPDAAFYMPFTRVWELGAGAMLAWVAWRRGPGAAPLPGHQFMGAAGLACIVAALGLLDRYKAFPGFWAVLPVLGACLCIAAGPQAWFNRRLLGARLFVWFGLISYPLYLWHWPLLAYARVLQEGFLDPPRVLRFGALGVSVLLAWLTFRFVERPLRRGGRGVVAGLAGAMVVLALVGAAAQLRWLLPRNDDPSIQAIMNAGADWVYPEALKPFSFEGQGFERIDGGPREVLLIGDSHVEQYRARALALAERKPDEVSTLVFATRGACPPIPNLIEDRDPICGERLSAALDLARTPAVKAVVIGGCWGCYFDVDQAPPAASAPPPPDHYYYRDAQGQRHMLRGGDGVDQSIAALGRLLAEIRAMGKTPYLLLNIPVGADFEPRSRLTGNRLERMTAAPVTPVAPLPPSQAALHERLRQLALANGAVPLDPMAGLCLPDGQCVRADGKGDPVYKDATHLRAAYVREAATFLDTALLAPASR